MIKSNKGFSLVELLIVTVIMGTLSAIVIVRFSGSSKSAKEAALKANLNSLRTQLELFRVRSALDQYPTNLFDLVNQGYMRILPKDSFYNSDAEYTTLQGPGVGGWVYDSSYGDVYVDIPSNDPVEPPDDTSWGSCYSAW